LAPSPAPVQPIPSESTLSSNLPCVSSSPPCRSAYKVCGLPSAHWRELTELWFCATTGNAHLDRLAAAEWGSVPGRILLDRMELRIHAGDLYEIQKMQWREQTSVKRLIARLNKQNQSASNASTATTPPTSTPASSLPSTSLWSPLPCAGCHAMLGSILLTVTPSSVEVASEMDVRLHKYALSNCFRTRQTQQTPSTSEVQQGMQTDTGHAKSTSASTVDTSTTMTSPDDLSHLLSAFASCLCSKYPNSSLLTCSNMFVCYSSENWIAEQLRQRHQASPINKFIITHPIDDDDEEHDAQDDGRDHSGVDRSDVGNDVEMKDGSSTVQRHKRLLIRLLVYRWDLPLSTTVNSAFPFTSHTRTSNAQRRVIQLEYDATQQMINANEEKTLMEMREEHEAAALWMEAGRASSSLPSSSSSSSSSNPSTRPSVALLYFTRRQCITLHALLERRSEVWPASLRVGLIDRSMRKSCLSTISKEDRKMVQLASQCV